MKTAFVTGVNGQSGSYLAEQLIEKGEYNVHGLVRRTSSFVRERIDHLGELELHYGDMDDIASLINILRKIRPDEIYNLAAQSHVGISWKIPCYTANTTGLGMLNLLEAVRILGLKPKIYQASTSELFDGATEIPQNENTPFSPKSPYSVAKLFAHQICDIYKKAYGMFIAKGILFNHESPRRGKNFITKKITTGIADIVKGKQDKMFLGNIEAKRDWGYAPEYTDAMWRMLQLDKPDDFVIATGESHSVKEFLKEAFQYVDRDWEDYVVIDKKYIRPSETDHLRGDASKAKRILGWEPKVKFKELVKIMMKAEIK